MGLERKYYGDARKSSMRLSDVVLNDSVSLVCYFSNLYESLHFVKHIGRIIRYEILVKFSLYPYRELYRELCFVNALIVDSLCCVFRKTPADDSVACTASVSTSLTYENFSSRTPQGINVKRTGR